jgi:hypothetical protein
MMSLDRARQRLLELVAERRTDLANVSRAIGRNHAYLQQYVRRHTPRDLGERERNALGVYFAVEPDEFRRTPADQTAAQTGPVDPDRLRRAVLLAESVVGDAKPPNRVDLIAEIAAAYYDVARARAVAGHPIDNDAEALKLVDATIRRLMQGRLTQTRR